MIELGLPWLLLALLIPLLWKWLIPPRQHAQTSFFFPAAVHTSTASLEKISKPPLWSWSFLLALFIWAGMVIAAAQPRWVGTPVPTAQQAREIMIAMDLSGSMQQEDMFIQGRPVSRLYAAHHILADFIRQRQGDRIGLIIYADSAHVYVPMTSDLETLAQLAEEAEIGLVGQSTALGDAIALSIQYFLDKPVEDRVIIILTDGEINSGKINEEQALQLAQHAHTKMYMIGIGSHDMVIQDFFGSRRINPSQELNEEFLTQIAQATGGEYFRAASVEDMKRIYQIIDDLEPLQQQEQLYRPMISYAHWPLLFSLVLSLLWTLFLFLRQYRQGRQS